MLELNELFIPPSIVSTTTVSTDEIMYKLSLFWGILKPRMYTSKGKAPKTAYDINMTNASAKDAPSSSSGKFIPNSSTSRKLTKISSYNANFPTTNSESCRFIPFLSNRETISRTSISRKFLYCQVALLFSDKINSLGDKITLNQKEKIVLEFNNLCNFEEKNSETPIDTALANILENPIIRIVDQ